MDRRQVLGLGIAAAATTLTGGCWIGRPFTVAEPPAFLDDRDSFSFFAAPAYASRPPRRVLILPAQTTVQPLAIQAQFAEQLAAQFRAGRLFETIYDPALGNCQCNLDTVLHGRFSEYRLLELTDRYQADALLVTRLNRINAVAPMEAAATCALIDRAEAVVLAAADGHWNTADPVTHRSWCSWLTHHCIGVAPETIAVYQASPRHFLSFIAWQIARRMAEPLGVDLAGQACGGTA